MRKKYLSPSKIYIEESVSGLPLTQKICKKFDSVPKETIADSSELIQKKKDNAMDPRNPEFLLFENKGNIVKTCPGTKYYTCCGYWVLNSVINCNLGCSYCILQTYINNPLISITANLEDLFHQLEELLEENQGDFFRIGTGELSDSLAYDEILEVGSQLVKFFSHQDNGIIELKTKTDNIEHLLDIDHNKGTVVSWSLNPPSLIKEEEGATASLEERIEAALKCASKGYHIGFHFDPLFRYDGWRDEYLYVVDKVFSQIPAESIAWVSLGAFRFIPKLKDIIEQRHPSNDLVYGEFLRGKDGKMRYFKPLRVELFRSIYKRIKFHSEEIFVYLCMESQTVWEEALDFYLGPQELSNALDERVEKK